MIEKTVEALNQHFKVTTAKQYYESKLYKKLASTFPSMLASMDEDEVILQAFLGNYLIKNSGRESITNVINVLTNKRYYFTGNDGKSSIFFPQLKSGSVELKDVHATTVGNQLL